MDFTIILLRKETLHKAKKEKKHRRKIMLIFWNLSLSFVLRIRESGSYENVAVLFQWCDAWKTNRQGRKRDPKQDGLKKTNIFGLKEKLIHYKTKVVTAVLFRFTKKTNNGREKSWSKLALFIISTVCWFWCFTAFEFIFSNRHCAHILLIKYQVLHCMRGKTKPFEVT